MFRENAGFARASCTPSPRPPAGPKGRSRARRQALEASSRPKGRALATATAAGPPSLRDDHTRPRASGLRPGPRGRAEGALAPTFFRSRSSL